MKLSNQPIVDVPRPWLWGLNLLLFAPLLTARLWFQPGLLDGVPSMLRSWVVIGPWMLVAMLAHNLLRRIAAARGAPVVRIGELVVRHGRWLGELPLAPALLLGLGSGLMLAAGAWLALPLTLPRTLYTEGDAFETVILAVLVLAGIPMVLSRRHVTRLYLADNAAALRDPSDRDSPANVEVPWPAPPWRMYGAWAVLYGLAAVAVVLMPGDQPGIWVAKLAAFPMAWLGGFVAHFARRRRGPSWRLYILSTPGKAAAMGALYLGAAFGVLFVPLSLLFGRIWPGQPLLNYLVYPVAALAAGLAYGAALGLFMWAMNATDLWTPKAAKTR